MTEAVTIKRFIVLIIAALALTTAFIFIGRHLSEPSDGVRLEPGGDNFHSSGVTITVLNPQPGGFISGDVVTSIEGRSMEEWAQALFMWGGLRSDRQRGEQVSYTILRDGQSQEIRVILGDYPLGVVLRNNWGTILFAIVFLIVGAYVFIRRPDQQAGRILFLSAACIMSATTWSFGLHLGDFVTATGFWLFKITTLGFYTLFWISGFHFATIFPKPLPLIRKFPGIIPASYLAAFSFIVVWILNARGTAINTLDWLRLWVPAEGIAAGVFLGLAMIAFFRQYRINTSGATRQQIRWVVWGGILSGGGGLFLYILPGIIGGTAINPNLAGVIVLPFPLAIAVAILRHNLFEIDRLINRTLIYGALVVLAGSIYLLVVGAFGLFFQAQGNWIVSLVATGVVAILVLPLRDWLTRWVNRRMYGERDDPFEVLTRLGQRLESTLSVEAVLPTLVGTIAQTLKLPYVGLVIPSGNEMKIVASYGKPTPAVIPYPLINQGETVGQMLIARRSNDEEFTNREEKLLDSIVRHMGAAVHNVLLTADLQQSRQHLVTAQEEERRRLRRDLHDGLGPTLAAHMLKIGLARSQLERNPSLVDHTLGELEEQTEGILAEVRRLVYDLRPPLLDYYGLVGAIKACADPYNLDSDETKKLQVRVLAPVKTPALPAAIEVAVFRIVQEALNNVSKHAQATCCTIELEFNKEVTVKLSDNGRGFPDRYNPGVGITSMRERAVELGGRFQLRSSVEGGAEIIVRIPFQQIQEKES
jgi:two-component system, NarL family, sensor kinase